MALSKEVIYSIETELLMEDSSLINLRTPLHFDGYMSLGECLTGDLCRSEIGDKLKMFFLFVLESEGV